MAKGNLFWCSCCVQSWCSGQRQTGRAHSRCRGGRPCRVISWSSGQRLVGTVATAPAQNTTWPLATQNTTMLLATAPAPNTTRLLATAPAQSTTRPLATQNTTRLLATAPAIYCLPLATAPALTTKQLAADPCNTSGLDRRPLPSLGSILLALSPASLGDIPTGPSPELALAPATARLCPRVLPLSGCWTYTSRYLLPCILYISLLSGWRTGRKKSMIPIAYQVRWPTSCPAWLAPPIGRAVKMWHETPSMIASRVLSSGCSGRGAPVPPVVPSLSAMRVGKLRSA